MLSLNALSACVCVRSDYSVALICTRLIEPGIVGHLTYSQEVSGLTLQAKVMH